MIEGHLDDSQLLRARAVFEKLNEPTDEFYLTVRPAVTTRNNGYSRREGGISVLMPYQYSLHRFGSSKHDLYPAFMDPVLMIGAWGDDESGILAYFPDWPEGNEGTSLAGGSNLRISQTSLKHNIDEDRLASFERFAARITAEWQEYRVARPSFTP